MSWSARVAMMGRSLDAGVRVEVPDSGPSRVIALDMDGADRLVAEWTVAPAATECRHVALSRSPDETRVGVRVDDAVWTFELATGDLVSHCEATTTGRDAGIVFWGEDGAAHIWLQADGPLDAVLAPGVTISVLGPVEEDDGEATSGGGGEFLFHAAGTSAADKDAALSRARAAAETAASADLHVRLAVTVQGHERVVHDDRTTPSAWVTRVQWPPLTGPRGVLLRRVHVRSEPPQAGTRQVGSQSYEVQHPCLVTRDGEIRTLPFELGNRPLTTMPDGRFLLPCYGPMWWDGPNEGMSVVDDDGRSELLQTGGEHVTPMGIVRAIDPSLVPAEDPVGYESDDAWTFVAARARADTLTVALEQGHRGADRGASWMLAELPLDGITCGPPRHIAGGTPPPSTVVRVAL